MKDGTAVALGDDRTLRDAHTHTQSHTHLLPLSCTHVRPALSFAAEMVPAWANLHNTLLTPLLYSSITPRQLLQVRAFVWACLWLCKARHKRLISQLFSPSLLLLILLYPVPLPPTPPPPPSPHHTPSSFIPRFHFTDAKPTEWQQPDNENNNASIFPPSPLTLPCHILRFSQHCIILLFHSFLLHPTHPPNVSLSCSSSSSSAPPPSVCCIFFIFVIPPYCTRADQKQIPCQSSSCSPPPVQLPLSFCVWI